MNPLWWLPHVIAYLAMGILAYQIGASFGWWK
jgi:hypothetical protein